MKLEDVLTHVGEPDAVEVLRPHWEESVACMDGVPGFLRPEEIRADREWCSLEPEMEAALMDAARRIAGDPALLRLAWHCSRLLYDCPEYRGCDRWPSLRNALGDSNGVFYLLVAMAMVSRVRALHGSMGVPEEVTRDTCREVWCFCDNHRRGHDGRPGIPPNQLFWLRLYPAGRLFRIGRMEYKLEPFFGGVEAYRSRETGRVVALAPDGVRFNGQGYVDGAGGITDSEHGWTAALAVDEDAVVGCPVSPYGVAVRQQVRLPLAHWEHVLAKGDTVMEMHIPAGGGMTPERCEDSMRRGAEFFRRFFPDRPFRAIVSWSWLFNTQLEEILPPDANLVRYQRELYLFPVPSSGRDGLWFIFLKDDLDPARLPRDTSLRRAVADFLAAGNVWRCGGMFYLTDHLPGYGSQHYRSQWPPQDWEDLGGLPPGRAHGKGGPAR